MTQQKILPRPGQRIECLAMSHDPAPIPIGTKGTVLKVSKFLTDYHIEVEWDNARTLNLISSVDKWRVLTRG